MSKKDLYWLAPTGEDTPDHLYWVPCKMVAEEGDKIQVEVVGEDEEDEPLYIKQSEARVVHPTVLEKMGNLLDLGEFDEGSLLHVIRSRFHDRLIYTNIGSPILIAVNPYQKLPELFNTQVARKYRQESLNVQKGMKATT